MTHKIELLGSYSSITKSQNYFFEAFDNGNAFIVRQNGPTSQLLMSDWNGNNFRWEISARFVLGFPCLQVIEIILPIKLRSPLPFLSISRQRLCQFSCKLSIAETIACELWVVRAASQRIRIKFSASRIMSINFWRDNTFGQLHR